jgi:hypothetical protein
VFGDATGDPLADRILTALRERPMSRTDISAALARHASREAIDRALNALRALGRVRCNVAPTGGRPTEVWEVVP